MIEVIGNDQRHIHPAFAGVRHESRGEVHVRALLLNEANRYELIGADSGQSMNLGLEATIHIEKGLAFALQCSQVEVLTLRAARIVTPMAHPGCEVVHLVEIVARWQEWYRLNPSM